MKLFSKHWNLNLFFPNIFRSNLQQFITNLNHWTFTKHLDEGGYGIVSHMFEQEKKENNIRLTGIEPPTNSTGFDVHNLT